MFAAAHVNMSLQINERIYALLEHHCDIPMKWLQSAFAKLGQRVAQEIASKGVPSGVGSACQLVGTAVARQALRAVIAGATDSIGYLSTIRAVSLTTGTTFAFVAIAFIQIPSCVRGVYKLHRKKKFNQIDEVTFKKGCAKEITMTAGAVLGGTAGAFTAGALLGGTAGSFLPIVGTLLGGAAGVIVGVAAGYATGYGIGLLFFKEGMIPDFVIVHTHLYTDYP